MKNIALFACDNGLGHIRRTLLLSNILSKFFKVNFFIQKKKIKKFLNEKSLSFLEVQITNSKTKKLPRPKNLIRIKNKFMK